MSERMTDIELIEKIEEPMVAAWELDASKEELLEVLHQADDHIAELEAQLKQQKQAAEDYMWAARKTPKLEAQIEAVKKVADNRTCLDSYEAAYIYAALKEQQP